MKSFTNIDKNLYGTLKDPNYTKNILTKQQQKTSVFILPAFKIYDDAFC